MDGNTGNPKVSLIIKFDLAGTSCILTTNHKDAWNSSRVAKKTAKPQFVSNTKGVQQHSARIPKQDVMVPKSMLILSSSHHLRLLGGFSQNDCVLWSEGQRCTNHLKSENNSVCDDDLSDKNGHVSGGELWRWTTHVSIDLLIRAKTGNKKPNVVDRRTSRGSTGNVSNESPGAFCFSSARCKSII